MLELLLTVLGIVLLTYIISPGWIIGICLGIVEFLFFQIAWWKMILILVGISLIVKCTKKVMKK